jgi:hypothetical protein
MTSCLLIRLIHVSLLIQWRRRNERKDLCYFIRLGPKLYPIARAVPIASVADKEAQNNTAVYFITNCSSWPLHLYLRLLSFLEISSHLSPLSSHPSQLSFYVCKAKCPCFLLQLLLSHCNSLAWRIIKIDAAKDDLPTTRFCFHQYTHN